MIDFCLTIPEGVELSAILIAIVHASAKVYIP
jgi:hypothetical protein